MKHHSQTIVLFAGTSEGRRLALHCAAEGRQVIVCVATEYGEQVLPEDENIRVHCGRMDEQEMHDFLRQEQMPLQDNSAPLSDNVYFDQLNPLLI